MRTSNGSRLHGNKKSTNQFTATSTTTKARRCVCWRSFMLFRICSSAAEIDVYFLWQLESIFDFTLAAVIHPKPRKTPWACEERENLVDSRWLCYPSWGWTAEQRTRLPKISGDNPMVALGLPRSRSHHREPGLHREWIGRMARSGETAASEVDGSDEGWGLEGRIEGGFDGATLSFTVKWCWGCNPSNAFFFLYNSLESALTKFFYFFKVVLGTHGICMQRCNIIS
jgi:hypothetical protein